MIKWDLNPSASQVQNCWRCISGNCFCLSLSYTQKVICIHTNQIKANQIIKSNQIITSNHVISNNQIKLNQITSCFCCSYLSFLIFLSKARIIWRSSPYFYFQAAKTARYHPNTADVTRLARQLTTVMKHNTAQKSSQPRNRQSRLPKNWTTRQYWYHGSRPRKTKQRDKMEHDVTENTPLTLQILISRRKSVSN